MENRLNQMESQASAPVNSKYRVSFDYDHQGRRRQKTVYTNNSTAYVAQTTNRYVYDGWNLVAILDQNNTPIQTFIWGLDLSGSEQGAGGVGGLLWENTLSNRVVTNTSFATFDGNGNVTALIATNGAVVAQYEYGPFGQLLRMTGPQAKANPFRFSTKFQDDETGLLYYGYRYYNPSTGRWPSRDPIQEKGGLNLYGFVSNGAVNTYDVLGLLVTGTLDSKAFTITFSDNDSKQTTNAQAFTGGHVNSDGSIKSPGTGLEAPAPAGDYWIIDNPNPKKGHEGWYGLIKKDDRLDDYFEDDGNTRSGVRLHLGRISWGCVTVNINQPDATTKWKSIQDLINGTKTDTIEFITGPHFWNRCKKVKTYGTLTIK
jgi:RHS repeat-associated protein